ncbi:MAG: hypothetical protein HA496_10575 [Thaumarchaeota archaeon]|nr:hypothetical protein [Nitrososphaerota archaeon]
MISPREIVEFYRMRARGFSKLYIILLLITINLFSISILLDVAKFFLAVPMLQAGTVVLAATLIVGGADKLRLERSKSNPFLILVESLRVTSYTILPILMIFVTVLFYLGKPSFLYFQNLRGVISMLIIFLILSVLAKIFIFQIQILVSPFENRKSVRYMLYAGTLVICFSSIISFVLSDVLLPRYLTQWFMYETFIFFLELIFLYLSAEVALNYRASVYIMMFLTYIAVVFFSLTGGAEIIRLSYTEYDTVFPKIVTGVFLLSINAQLMDSRLKQFSLGQFETRSEEEATMDNLLSILEGIRRDVDVSKKTIEKQDNAIKVLTRIIERMTVSSSGAIEELRRELKNIRPSQTISSLNTSFSKRLAEEILKLWENHKDFPLGDLAGFILGPRPMPAGSRRAVDLENISPIPLFIMVCMTFLELQNPDSASGKTVQQKDLAGFLVSNHPHFRMKWSRRTAQNFVNSFILKYLKSCRESGLFFSIGNRGSISLTPDSSVQTLYESVREYVLDIGLENIPIILLYIPKIRDLTLKELNISENDLKKIF